MAAGAADGASGYVCRIRCNLGQGVTGPDCAVRARDKLVGWKDENSLMRGVEDEPGTHDLIGSFISHAEEVIVFHNQPGEVRTRFINMLDDAHINPQFYRDTQCVSVEESNDAPTARDPLRPMLHALVMTANCMMRGEDENIRVRVFNQLKKATVHVSNGCWIIRFDSKHLEIFMSDAPKILRETATNFLDNVIKDILEHPSMKAEKVEQIKEILEIFKEKCFFELETSVDDWNKGVGNDELAMIRIIACWEIGLRSDDKIVKLQEMKQTLAMKQQAVPEKLEKVYIYLDDLLSGSSSTPSSSSDVLFRGKRALDGGTSNERGIVHAERKRPRLGEASNKLLSASSDEGGDINPPSNITYERSDETGGQCYSALLLKSGIPIDAGKQYDADEPLHGFGPFPPLTNRWIHCLAMAQDELFILQKAEDGKSFDVHIIRLDQSGKQFLALNTALPPTSNFFFLDTNGSRMIITNGKLIRVYTRNGDTWDDDFDLENLFVEESITGVKMFADGSSFIVCTHTGVYRLPLRPNAHPKTNCMWLFSEREMENNQLKKARCVYIDESRNYLMVGSMHKDIHLFSTSGNYLQTLPLDIPDEIISTKPHILVGLDVQEGKLLVADRNYLHFFKLTI